MAPLAEPLVAQFGQGFTEEGLSVLLDDPRLQTILYALPVVLFLFS